MNSLSADNDIISSDTFEYNGNIYLRFEYVNNEIVWHKMYENRKGEYVNGGWILDNKEIESKYKRIKKLERITK